MDSLFRKPKKHHFLAQEKYIIKSVVVSNNSEVNEYLLAGIPGIFLNKL